MAGAYYDDPDFLYGDADRFYSDMPVDFDFDRLIWRFEVAWRGDMAFFAEDNGGIEGRWAIDCSWSRGRRSWMSYNANGLAFFDPGRMVITLLDPTDRYNPYNTSSPLYPYIEPGKFCRYYVRRNGSMTHVPRFSGIIQDIRNHADETGQKLVDITIADGWSSLQDHEVYLATVSNTNPKFAIPNVLAAVDWPEMWGHSLEDGPILLPFFWSGGDDARSILHNIAHTLGSKVFITGDGKVHYQSRSSAEPASVVSLTQSDLLKDIPVNNLWDNRLNTVEMLAHSILVYSALGTLWGDTIKFNPLPEVETKNVPEFSIASESHIKLSGKYDVPTNLAFPVDARLLFGYNVSVPDTRLVFQFGTLTGNAGIDITSYISAEIFDDGGGGFQARLRNNYPGVAYLRRILIANTAYAYVQRGSVQFSKTSVAIPKTTKKFTVSTPYMINAAPLSAELPNILNWYYARVSRQWVLPRITIESRPDIQFVDIMDVISLDIAAKKINGSFRVGMIEERWLTPTGQAVSTTIQTEPSP